MPSFFGIEPGQEISRPGIRVNVPRDGECAYMHGKWIDLAAHHGVVFIDVGETAQFVTPKGVTKSLGDFPAWVVRGTGKRAAMCAMFGVDQFRGGRLVIRKASSRREYEIAA